jgi:hypothetical protein
MIKKILKSMINKLLKFMIEKLLKSMIKNTFFLLLNISAKSIQKLKTKVIPTSKL